MPFGTRRSVLMSEDLSRGDGSSTRVIAVSSGKGGVGKSNVVANLAVALTRVGKRVPTALHAVRPRWLKSRAPLRAVSWMQGPSKW